MLSEVLREREAQINYKKKRQDLMKNQDDKHIKQQQQVGRQISIKADVLTECWLLCRIVRMAYWLT